MKMLGTLMAMGMWIGFSGCGDDTATVNVPLNISSDVQTLINTTETTMRFYYTHEGLNIKGKDTFLLPASALPTQTTVTNGNETSTAVFWETAGGKGYSLSDKAVTFRNVPLNKLNTRIVVELIQFIGDQWYVVAAGCYEGPAATGLTAAQISADVGTVGIDIVKKRSCGTACRDLFTYSDPKKAC